MRCHEFKIFVWNFISGLYAVFKPMACFILDSSLFFFFFQTIRGRLWRCNRNGKKKMMTNSLCSIHLFKSGDRVRCLFAMKKKGRQNWNRMHMSAIIQIVAASIGTVRLSRINNSPMQIVTPYFSFHLTRTRSLARKCVPYSNFHAICSVQFVYSKQRSWFAFFVQFSSP